MSEIALLKVLFSERLASVAVEIFDAVEKTFVKYKADVHRSYEEKYRLLQLYSVAHPDRDSTIDRQQFVPVTGEDGQQGLSASLSRESELPRIQGEAFSISTRVKEEELEGPEDDFLKLTVPFLPVLPQGFHSQAVENTEGHPLTTDITKTIKTQTYRENYETAEPASRSQAFCVVTVDCSGVEGFQDGESSGLRPEPNPVKSKKTGEKKGQSSGSEMTNNTKKAAVASLFAEMGMGQPDAVEDAEMGRPCLVEILPTGDSIPLYDVKALANSPVSPGPDGLFDENDGIFIPSEEDPDQIDSTLVANEPPDKKARVDMSQLMSRKRQSASIDSKIPTLGVPCDKDKCPKKCTLNITHDRRKAIFDVYWSMNGHERKSWIFNSVSKGLKRSHTTGGRISRRSMTYSYHLEAEDGTSYEVCKTFFLATLGYHPRNDRFIMTVLQATSLEAALSARDGRGRHTPSNKLDTNPIKAHIESFGLSSGQYRDAHTPGGQHSETHAPEQRCLPKDLTISFMYRDYKDKNPGAKCSYEAYRKLVNELNVSFTQPEEGDREQSPGTESHPYAFGHEQTTAERKC